MNSDGYRIAIIPASEHVDLDKAREVFGASADMRLATEPEIVQAFPAFDPGALPPFRGLLGTPEVLDTRLLHYHRILCSAGDHRHTLKISPEEISKSASRPWPTSASEARPSTEAIPGR